MTADSATLRLKREREYSRLHAKPTLEDWVPPSDSTIRIVAAACKDSISGTVFVGSRHYSPAMRSQIKSAGIEPMGLEQGFIDQWDRFYTREEARDVVGFTGQVLTSERLADSTLYSENLY